MIVLKSKWHTQTSTGIISKGIYSINGEDYFVKGNSEEGYLEPYSEVIASKAAKLLDLNVVDYELAPKEYFKDIHVYGRCQHVSICKKIDGNLYQFYNTMKLRGYNLVGRDPLRVYKEVGLSQEHLWKMLVLDAFVGNQDRHLNNFDIMYRDNKLVNAPILDTGASCLYNVKGNELKIYGGEKIGPDSSKPFKDTHSRQIHFLEKQLDVDKNIFEDTSKEEFFNALWEDCEEVFFFFCDRRVESIKSYLWKRYDKYIEPYKKVNQSTSLIWK